MYAIIETGGKQYRVEPDEVMSVEKLAAQPGDTVEFDRVALVSNEGEVRVGKPWVEGAKVVARVLAHGKDPKITVFTYKAKENYKRKKGHRQLHTRVRVESITGAGKEG
jgi:large subunit ribosomal protein L21